MLASCYRSSLELARKHELRTVAFPAISTGIFGYPLPAAAEVAAATVAAEVLATPEAFDRIVFVCFDETATEIFRSAVEKQRL